METISAKLLSAAFCHSLFSCQFVGFIMLCFIYYTSLEPQRSRLPLSCTDIPLYTVLKAVTLFRIWYYSCTRDRCITDIQIAPCICSDTGRGHGWCRLSFRFNSFIDWYPSVIFEVTCQELSLNRYHSVIKKMKGGSTSWTQIKSVRGALWRDMTITRKPQRKSPFNGLNYFILMSCWT